MSRFVCIWEFRSVDGKQVARSIRPAHPDDSRYQHEYQRIIYRGFLRDYEESPCPSK